MNEKLQSSRQSVFDLKYHIILSTKYRHKCITQEMLLRMKEIFSNISQSWRCELIEFNGEADHVHLLVSAHPSMDLSRFIGNLKTTSSRYLRKEFSEHLRRFFWKNKLWNNSYAVVTAGGHANIEQLIKYIQDQQAPNNICPA